MYDIKSMDIDELAEMLSAFGEPKYRAKQIFKWLQSGIVSFDEMTNIPKSLRERLKDNCYIACCEIAQSFKSQIDDTVKYLFKLYDSEYIESVFMKYEHGYTVCISTQVGCNMGCKFCASALFGKTRDLTASEMLSQITAISIDRNVRISNVVLMGMGEPLDNFSNTSKFLKLVSDKDGLCIGLRHISLSTCGIVSGIEKLSELNLPITLSVSLHAPFDEIRSSIMPVNNKWKIDALIGACRKYQAITKRRISFEYALISGVNDTDLCARELGKITKGLLCHINLIPANMVEENSYSKPDNKRINTFKDALASYGLNVTVRRTLGADINASCGQLRRQIRKEPERAVIQQS